MKSFVTLIASTVALFAVAGIAAAQQPGPSTGVQVPAAKGKANKANKADKKAQLAKLDEQQKKAFKATSGAIKLVERALPIYDGHRALAIDLMKTARMDLVTGANNQAIQTKKGKKGAKLQVAEGHDKSKFTQAQIEASQKALGEAVEILNRAIEDLNGKTDSYNTEAVSNLKKAQDELKAAIALHSTP